MREQIVENLGQVDDRGIALYLRGRGASVAFLADRITVALEDATAAGGGRRSSYGVVFDGADPVAPEGIDPTGTEHNYFLGSDPSGWVTGARGFSGVRYAGLWDGIDLVYRLANGGLKYDLVVSPGADPGSVRMRYSGVEEVHLDASGALTVSTAAGVCRDGRPETFQEGPDGPMPVESAFVLLGPTTVGFEVGERDRSKTLVIDPVLVFSTFLGGSDRDDIKAALVDPDGNILVAGFTFSPGFPTTGDAFNGTYAGSADCFLSKLAPVGASLVYSTFLGGPSSDGVYGMDVDGSGAVFLTGVTYGDGFPVTTGAYDTGHNGRDDAFVVKVNATGRALDYSTYVGGTSTDKPHGICVDADGEAVVAGETYGDFPTTAGAMQETYGGMNTDAFAFRLDAKGQALVWSTYVGGRFDDVCMDVALDAQGNAVLVGSTKSDDFPIGSGGYDTTLDEGTDMFVMRLSARGGARMNATYIGGRLDECLNDVFIDPDGGVHAVGTTRSSGMPTSTDAYDRWGGMNGDIYICELDPSLSSIVDATYVGATGSDGGSAIWVDPAGCTHVVGSTSGDDFPVTPDALSTTLAGSYDTVYLKLSAKVSTLIYSTFIGGAGTDVGRAVTSDGRQLVYVAGETHSADFPTTDGALDTVMDGNYDAFVLGIRYELPPRWLDLPPMDAVEDVPLTIDLTDLVRDPDTPKGELTLRSPSTYVTALSGLNVTLLFPEGVLDARIPLVLSDGLFEANANLNFTVEPVNDPPFCACPREFTVTEDVPRVLDFTNWVTDVDSARGDLRLVVDSPYANATGLSLTVTAPEGVLAFDLPVNVSDGIDATEILLHITATPVDDPPVVGELPPLTVVEDQDAEFDLGPYLSDIDTPVDQLRFAINDDRVSVEGTTLHLLFTVGDVDVDVPVDVLDATNRVPVVLRVHVQGVDDPPVVLPMQPRLLLEDEPTLVDLSDFIEDEDTPLAMLVLECSDPRMVGPASGLGLVLLCTTPVEGFSVAFSVSDGVSTTHGSFDVVVTPVDDPPVVLGVGPYDPPVALSMMEGDELWLEVRVSDEDSAGFDYSVSSSWSGITALPNGTLLIVAAQADVGTHHANVTVDDRAGGVCTLALSVEVVNIDDPPSVPIIKAPMNHTTVEEGTNVTFRVEVADPDTALGQVLTVTWTSNVSGPLMTLTSDGPLTFTTDALPAGVHRITVTVTDGTHTRTAWLELTVIERHVPPPEEPSFLATPAGVAAIAVVVAVAVIVALLGASRTRRLLAEREAEERERAQAEAARRRQAEAEVEITMGGDLARLSRDLGDSMTRLEAQRAAEAIVAAPAAPAPVLAPVATATAVTAEEEADRERTRETREVMRALTQLPQGLPTSLAGWDLAELARTIVDGEKRTAADGTLLVSIKGRWHCADRSDIGTFAREWKEPGPAPAIGGPLTDAERAAHVERLEADLLEGKISEATYKQLKKKYEGG